MDDLFSAINGAIGGQGQDDAPMHVDISGVGSKSTATKYDGMFASTAQKYSLDPNLLKGIAKTESSLNANATSKDQNGKPIAHGLMQFTPATASAIGVNDPYDPAQSIEGAGKLMRQNLDASNGDVTKALMMYHGGTNTKNWGPLTQAYPGKVLGTQQKQQPQQPDDPSAFNASTVFDAINGKITQTAQQNSGFNLPATSQQGGAIEQAQAKNKKAGVVPVDLSNVGVGAAETALHMGSSMVGQAVGGLAGIFTGNADNISKVQNALTYEPRTDSGKAILQNVGAGAEQAKNFAMAVPGVAGLIKGYQAANDAVGEVSPVAGAVMKTLPTAAGLLLAPEVRGAFGAAANGRKTLLGNIGKTAAEMPRIDPTIGPKPRVKLNTDGSITPIEQAPAVSGVTPEMMSKPKTQVDAPAAPITPSPEVQAAIDKAGYANNPTAVARHTEASSLPVPVDLTAGQATGNVHQLSWEQNTRGKNPDLANRMNGQNGQLIQNFDAIRSQVAPGITASGSDLGQAHIDAYKTMDAPIQADIRGKYKALEDANGGQFPLDGQSFVSSTEAALDKALKSGSVPADIQRSLDQFKNGRQMTFQDFETLRSDLADTMRTASDGRQRAAANIIRQQLESMPLTPDAQQLKPLADAARNAAKARFDAIDSDPAYKAAINDGVAANEPSPLADKFIKNYVVNGKTANVQNMIGNLSNDPKNIQIMRAGVVDHLKDASGIDLRTNAGNVSQSRLNGAIENLDKRSNLVLGEQGTQQINALGNVARYTMEQPKGSYVNNSGTTVSALANGAKDLALGAANIKTLGAVNFVRGRMAAAAEKSLVQKSLAPGAGIKLSDFPR